MSDSFTVVQTSLFVGMIWLLAVNDINLVNKVKNQTENLSLCFLSCILYLRTSNRLISLKLDSSLQGFTVFSPAGLASQVL